MTVLLQPVTHYTPPMTDLPNVDKALFQNPDNEKLQVSAVRPS